MEISASRYRSLPRGFLPAQNKQLLSGTSQDENKSASNQPPVKSGIKITRKKNETPNQAPVVQQAPAAPQIDNRGLGRMSVKVSQGLKYSDTL